MNKNNFYNKNFNDLYKDKNVTLNLNCIRVSKVKNQIFIESFQNFTKIKTTLVYETTLKKIYEIKPTVIKSKDEFYFSFFLGIKMMNHKNYLIFVNNCNYIDFYLNKENEIFKIIDIKYLEINDFKIDENLFEKYNNYNIYFSYDFDVAEINGKINNLFFINKHLSESLLYNKCYNWVRPVVDGYFFKYFFLDSNKNKIILFIKIMRNNFYNNDTNLFLNKYNNFLGINSTLTYLEVNIIFNENIYNSNIYFHSFLKRPRYDENINLNHLLNHEKMQDIENYIISKEDMDRLIYLCKFYLNIKKFFIIKEKWQSNQEKFFDLFEKFYSKENNFNMIEILSNLDINAYILNILKQEEIKILFLNDVNYFLLNNLNNIIFSYVKLFFMKNDFLKKLSKNDENKLLSILEVKLYYFNFNKKLYLKNLYISSKDYCKTIKNYYTLKKNITNEYDFNILFLTFNLGGYNFEENLEQFYSLLYIKEIKNSSIIIFNFQEIIEMKRKNLGKIITEDNNEEKNKIIKVLEKFLSKYNFQILFENGWAGLFFVIFIKITCPLNCKINEYNYVKLGFLKFFANKGFIYFNLKINNINLNIVNCHLCSDPKNIKKRNEEFNQILNFLKNKESDVDIVVGDFNFRSQNTIEKNYKYINKYFLKNTLEEKLIYIKKLLKGDEFLKHNNNGFKEKQINFLPTYKYDLNNPEFKKEYNPSYCDRIFYKNKKLLYFENLSYFSNNNSFISDHRCVYGQFKLRVNNLNYFEFGKEINKLFF